MKKSALWEWVNKLYYSFKWITSSEPIFCESDYNVGACSFCMLLANMGQLQDVFSVYCFRILSQCSVFLFHRIQFRLESHKFNFFNSGRRNTASLIPIPSLLISLSFSLPLFPRAECLCYVNVFHHSSDLPGLSEHVIAFLSLPLASLPHLSEQATSPLTCRHHVGCLTGLLEGYCTGTSAAACLPQRPLTWGPETWAHN